MIPFEWTKLASESRDMDQTCVFEENYSDYHEIRSVFRRETQWTKLATECICRHMTEEVVDQFLLEILIMCQNFEMAHFFSSKILRWLKIRIIFCLEFNFSSNSEPSQNFRTKKVSHLKILPSASQDTPVVTFTRFKMVKNETLSREV